MYDEVMRQMQRKREKLFGNEYEAMEVIFAVSL